MNFEEAGGSKVMDFGEALFLMRAGKKVRRAAWPDGWGLFIKGRAFSLNAVEYETVNFQVNSVMALATDWQEV